MNTSRVGKRCWIIVSDFLFRGTDFLEIVSALLRRKRFAARSSLQVATTTSCITRTLCACCAMLRSTRRSRTTSKCGKCMLVCISRLIARCTQNSNLSLGDAEMQPHITSHADSGGSPRFASPALCMSPSCSKRLIKLALDIARNVQMCADAHRGRR